MKAQGLEAALLLPNSKLLMPGLGLVITNTCGPTIARDQSHNKK